MGLFDQFPYTNFHELNLDWILKALKELEHTIDQFVAINALKYADPIQWNITSQYEKNTIVIDPLTGTAYISVQPVPAGVAITREEYWSVVFDLGSFVVRAAKNFTNRWESEWTLTATFPSNAGDWLVWNDTLYKVLSNIIAGDQYVIGSNIQHFTMEDIIGHLEDLTTTDKTNLVAAINEVLNTLLTTTGDLNDLTTTDKTNLVAAINEVLNTLLTTTGDLNDLTTTDKTNLVAAINETVSDISNINTNIGDLTDLDTVDQSNLVNAINEVFANSGVYNKSTPDSGLTTNIGLKEGTYDITSNLTINAQLIVPKGAILNIASGVTLTINGQILAGRYQIFTGAGSVVVDKKSQPVGYPEWFGAVANDSNVDSAAALNTCLSTFNVTELTSGTYYVGSTVVMNTKGSVMRGQGMERGGQGSIIKATTNLNPVLLMGYTSLPASINDFCDGLQLENLCVSGIGADFTNNTTTIQIAFALRGRLTHVTAKDSSVCLHIRAAVTYRITECQFYATTPSNGDTTRTIELVKIYDSANNHDVGSGCSIQLNHCTFVLDGVQYANSTGIKVHGNRFSDLMITGCEMITLAVGIQIAGNNDRSGALDILISNNLIDSVKRPIDLSNLGFGNVNVTDNYLACDPNGDTIISLYLCDHVTISGNQIVGINANIIDGITGSTLVAAQLIDNTFYEVTNCLKLFNTHNCKLSGVALSDAKTGANIIDGDSVLNSVIDFTNYTNFGCGIHLNTLTGCSVNFAGMKATDPLNIGGTSVTPANGYDSNTNNYFFGIMA